MNTYFDTEGNCHVDVVIPSGKYCGDCIFAQWSGLSYKCLLQDVQLKIKPEHKKTCGRLVRYDRKVKSPACPSLKGEGERK
jgi:hypothetical protein